MVTQVETLQDSTEYVEEQDRKSEYAKPIEIPKEKYRIDRVPTQTREIEETLLKSVDVEKFGPGKQPLTELAKVAVLMRHGVTVDEVRCCCCC